jgi:hypothetical protein
VDRLTNTQNVDIGEIQAFVSCTRALALADITNLTVGHVSGENVRARLIELDEGQDASDGNIDGVYIGGYHAVMNSGARAVFGLIYGTLGVRTLANFVVGDGFATGYSDFFAITTSTTLAGLVYLKGKVGGADPAPAIENPVDSVQLVLDIAKNSQRYIGKAIGFDMSAGMTFRADAFDPAGAPTGKGSLFINAPGATAGTGNYGGGVAFSRVGSSRRAAAVAAKQITSDAKQVGLSFFVQNTGTTSTEVVTERMVLKHTGVLNLNNLPTYADEAAAGAGGLVQGDMYKTATGELRIKL